MTGQRASTSALSAREPNKNRKKPNAVADAPVDPAHPPCDDDPDEIEENKPRVIAIRFHDWVVARDGKKPALTVPALIKRVEHAQKEGFNRAEIKQGLVRLHERGLTVTDQNLRNAMTHRLPGDQPRQRPPAQGQNDDWITKRDRMLEEEQRVRDEQAGREHPS